MASQAPPSYRMALWDVQSAAHLGTRGPWLQLDGLQLSRRLSWGQQACWLAMELWGQNIGVLGLTLPHASGHVEHSAMGFRTVTCTGRTCMYRAAVSSK